MRLRNASIAVILAAGLAGCNAVSGPAGSETGAWGTPFGAASGPVAGDEASTAISKLLDNAFGQSLEASDRQAAADAQRRALRARGVGVAVAWENGETGRSGQVRPGPLYHVNDTSCREFTHHMVLNGNVLTARGTACRSENGSWETIG